MEIKISSKKINLKIVTATIFVILFSLPAVASYIPFNTSTNIKIGIGTSSPGSNLSILGGESVGSYATSTAPAGSVIASGNVGIGTFNPFGGGLIILPANTGNVGIGSLTPGQALDVNGIVRSISGGFIFPDGSTQTSAASGGNSWSMSNGNVYTTTSSNNVGIGTSTPQTGFVVLNGNVGIGTWTAAGGALMIQGGNVGIGTVNANKTLTVNGTIYSTSGGIQFPDNTTQTTAAVTGSNYWLNNGGSNVGINTTQAVGIGTSFVGGTGEATLAVMNGNVGIGTWAPTASLAVGTNAFTVNSAGAITATTGITTSGAYTQSGTGINYFTGNVGIGTWVPAMPLEIVNNGGWQQFRSGTSIYKIIQSTQIGADATADLMFNTGQSSSGYGWTNSNGNKLFGIDANGNVGIGTFTTQNAGLSIMNGNVGIGTWVPASALQVNGDIIGNNIYIGAYGDLFGTYGAIYNGDENVFTGVNGYTASGGGSPGLYFDLINGLTLSETGRPDFNIDSNGNVGVGTTAPQTRFAVVGGNVGIGTWTAAGGNLIVNGGGNVGIGSAWPGQVLDVQGTVRATNFVGNGAGLTNLPSSSLWATQNTTDESLAGGNVGIGTTITNAGAALTIMNGNVGIGTWVPGAALQVGSGPSYTTISTVDSTGFHVGNGLLYNLEGSGLWEGGTLQDDIAIGGEQIGGAYPWVISSGSSEYGGGYITFQTDGTQRATVTDNGVGIGTTVPTGSLEIEGGNVGIGTAFTTKAALSIMNGNVGIGTWVPGAALQVAGSILSSSTSGIGYTKGAGSTVTQSTSKSTGVTINAATGTITMNGAALVAATIVTFTVTDSTVAATDCIFTQHDSGGTIGAYTITANSPAAGSFNISVRNNTAGSLSEAIVIRFAVIKAVTS